MECHGPVVALVRANKCSEVASACVRAGAAIGVRARTWPAPAAAMIGENWEYSPKAEASPEEQPALAPRLSKASSKSTKPDPAAAVAHS